MDLNNIQLSDLMSLGSLVLREPHHLHPDSAWLEHIPFAFWLVEHHQPQTIVELGVHTGPSYCAFCQAVVELGLSTRCFGVDTFEGDAHTRQCYRQGMLEEIRAYHDPLYSGFSRLIPTSFDAALKHFSDGSIDLLHIDGCHFYEDVKHDFETWLPKLSRRAIVIFHDTNVRERGFGVFKLWAEIENKYPSFEFFHGHGLGVLAVGHDMHPAMAGFFSSTETKAAALRQIFSVLGSRLTFKMQAEKIPALEQANRDLGGEIAMKSRSLDLLQEGAAQISKQLEEAKTESLALQKDSTERIKKLKAEFLRKSTQTGEHIGELEDRLQQQALHVENLMAELRGNASRIANIENRNSELQKAVDSAVQWQRSWLKRVLRRWNPPNVHGTRSGFFRRLEKSIRKRRKKLFNRHPGSEVVSPVPSIPVISDDMKRKREEAAVADYVMRAIEPWFDRQYYLSEYPDVAQLGIDPLVHFYEHGEEEGRKPRADFDPIFYLATNLDVKYLQSSNPLECANAKHPFFHYVIAGKEEGRDGMPWMEPLLVGECDFPENFTASSVALVAHVFYPDLWNEIQDVIAMFPSGCRLYISLVEGHSCHLDEAIRAQHPTAQIEIVKNRGRDVLPFLSQLRKTQADNVRVALKIHTKKTLSDPGARGDVRRKDLFSSLAPSKRQVNAIINTFDTLPRTGVLIPYCHSHSMRLYLADNRPIVERLAAAMGISFKEEELDNVGFPAGTMFWFRPEALLPVTGLGLSADEFPEEKGQMDATLAHGIERIIGLAPRVANFETCTYTLQSPHGKTPVASYNNKTHNLERKYPGITKPVGLHYMQDLVHRNRDIQVAASPALMRPRMNFLMPDLNPDIIFGGYIAALEFAAAMHKHYNVRFVLTEQPFTQGADLVQKFASNPRVGPMLRNAAFLDASKEDAVLSVGKGDFFCAFSAWSYSMASRLAHSCGHPAALYFCQEDEASFHSNDALHAVVSNAQRLPQFTIFNSELLREHFRAGKLGVYADSSEHGDANSVVFNHALVPTHPLPLEDYLNQKKFRVLFYARPEHYARRNLFETGILGLKEFLRLCPLSLDEVEFIGVGTLGYEAELPLGGEHRICIRPRLDLESYSRSLAGFDVGLSLMYAPHPGIMHFELAAAGVLSVTNTFGVRTAARLSAISQNIIPIEASIAGVAGGLQLAWSRRKDYESRIKGASFESSRCWTQTYNEDFMNVIRQRVAGWLSQTH